MLIIKYNIAPSDRILQKIYNNSFEIENKEKYLLELLLHELQTEYKNVVLWVFILQKRVHDDIFLSPYKHKPVISNIPDYNKTKQEKIKRQQTSWRL